MALDPRLVSVAIQELPGAIAFIKMAFGNKHPDQPEPTDAEVISAFESAFQSSLAKDERWLAEHPE